MIDLFIYTAFFFLVTYYLPPSLVASFIIGSSLPVTAPGLIRVARGIPGMQYDPRKYSYIAPLYIGTMNVLFTVLGTVFGWSMQRRLVYTSLVSYILVASLAIRSVSYVFPTRAHLAAYLIRLAIYHLLIFNVYVATLEQIIARIQKV